MPVRSCYGMAKWGWDVAQRRTASVLDFASAGRIVADDGICGVKIIRDSQSAGILAPFFSYVGPRMSWIERLFSFAIFFSVRFPVLAVAALMPPPAAAEVDKVLVENSGVVGSYGGREYSWVNAQMHGTMRRDDGSLGHYRVPISMVYPDRISNGFGFIDAVNSADFELYSKETSPLGMRKIYYAGEAVLGDYLKREGYVYISVQWARLVTDALGPDYGVVEDARDGFQILKDAASFLRSPGLLVGDLEARPPPVDYVIAFGQSQTAGLLLELVRSGRNRSPDGVVVIDGILAQAQPGCRTLNNDSTPLTGGGGTAPRYGEYVRCIGSFPPDGKVISLLTESDVEQFGSHTTRHDTATFRQYELAGIAHIPPEMIPLNLIGATRQNPISLRPAARGALRNLADWIRDGGRTAPVALFRRQRGC